MNLYTQINIEIYIYIYIYRDIYMCVHTHKKTYTKNKLQYFIFSQNNTIFIYFIFFLNKNLFYNFECFRLILILKIENI